MVRALYMIRPSESTVWNLGARSPSRTNTLLAGICDLLDVLRTIQDEQNGGSEDSEDHYDLHDDDYDDNYETDDCDGEDKGYDEKEKRKMHITTTVMII